MLQIETRAGLAALDDIASTDGVDCVFIGPADLSADMGYLGNIFAPEVQSVIEDAFKRIIGHGKAAGVYMANPEYARRYLDMGVQFIALGSDASVLSHGAHQLKSFHK
jgi:4-hydroxy-2-oxoheptanedioate aldolase